MKGTSTAIADSLQQKHQMPTSTNPLSWAAGRPKKKGIEYYNSRRENYSIFGCGGDQFDNHDPPDVKTRKFIGVRT